MWQKLLTASSTSEAIQLATLVPLRELQRTPLPVPFSELSPNAQKNLKALCRALETSFGGIQDDGWDLWKDAAHDINEWDKAIEIIKQKPLEPGQYDLSEVPLPQDMGKKEATFSISGKNGLSDARNLADGSDISTSKPSSMKDTDAIMSKRPAREKNESISAEERKSAERIRNWAQVSSHTTPPQDAIDLLSKSTDLLQILQIMVPHDVSPLVRAAVISCFTDKIGTTMANLLMNATILPYVQTLESPAPREVMKSVVRFCSFHWRSAITLYKHFAQGNQRVNGAVAELLSRVGSELKAEAALSALKEYRTGVWGEDGIRVVETLLSRCKEQPDVLEFLMPSL